ncbi:MAG TPA: helicase-exonuclease AddAB subunit AddA, partial [Clostridiales bacterium]|nr:helicase-exonuclease AddAB subunit AddA [Clostridiales bacterium]
VPEKVPEKLPGKVPEMKKPLFLTEIKGLTAAEAGTAMHFVLQHLDLHDPDLKTQIDGMVARDLLSPVQAKSVDPGRIQQFLDSPLGMRLLAAKTVRREVPFQLQVPCGEVYKDTHLDNETVLLQGMIDCWFEEPEGLVLLDYKTDRVQPGREGEIRERYRLQWGYYTRALEQLSGKPVKQRFLVLLATGEALEVERVETDG